MGRNKDFPELDETDKSRIYVPTDIRELAKELIKKLWNDSQKATSLNDVVSLVEQQDTSSSAQQIYSVDDLVSASFGVLETDSMSYDPFDLYNHVVSENSTKKTPTIAIRVSGDSMVNAGIFPQDILIAEFVRGEWIVPNTRDIVIVRIGDETTVKRYYLNDDEKTITLMPESPNTDHQPRTIFPGDENYEVLGIVRQVIHNPKHR